MAAKKKSTTQKKETTETEKKSTTKKSTKKSNEMIALTFLPILGAAQQYTALLRKKTINKVYGREVSAYAPAIDGLPVKLTVKKGEVIEVTKEQFEELQKRGHVESDEEYKERQNFIKNLNSQHPETLTWDMIVAEGSNFATLRDSQDIIYNDKLIRK